MLNTLSGRVALLLSPLFVAGGALLAGLTLRMPALPELVATGAALLAAAVAFALLAALLVFRLLTRRLQRLAQAIEAFRAGRFREPVRLGWARDDGDEIDRLAAGFVQMAAHMTRQIGELESHDRQRRELLANVSHDLRTPLALMQGYLETLLLQVHGNDPKAQRAYLEVATRHAERMGRLVAELFELAKLDGAAPEVAPETFVLTELVQDVAQKFELPAQARRVAIETRIDADTPPVHGDIGLIERALENLIENALRHTPPGGTVGVDVEPGDGRVHVRVRDTGCGIDAQHLPHVFDRYFRAARVETGAPHEPGGHAGLGLAIAQRIVALHGGRIQVFSRPGAGAAFTFDVQAAAAHA
jgi:signal transduction histidine kinase